MDTNKTNLMTGSIWKSILIFSLPLLAGNLFQQLYNTVDSYVVGNYVNANALAAVRQSTPIINMLVGFFMGLATGAGGVISQFYGAHMIHKMKKTIHTSIILTCLLSIFFTVIGILISKPILIMIGSPKEVLPLATAYLQIFFSGMTFTLFYNMGSGILRAIGDSKNPLIYLIISSLVNIVLDFFFVLYCHMGVSGVGIATVIAQGVSAILVMIKLLTTKEDYAVCIKQLHLDYHLLKKIIAIGIPAALQNSIVSFSNVVVQSYISSFGATAVAGYATTVKLDGFLQLPIQSFALAITTFVGQNYGAKQYDRVKKGLYVTLGMGLFITGIGIVVLLTQGKFLLGLFTDDKQVIQSGYLMIQVFMAGYIVLPISNTIAGALRGVGLSKVPMYILVLCYVILRQIYLFVFTKFNSSLAAVYAGWPITWAICTVILVIYAKKANWISRD